MFERIEMDQDRMFAISLGILVSSVVIHLSPLNPLVALGVYLVGLAGAVVYISMALRDILDRYGPQGLQIRTDGGSVEGRKEAEIRDGFVREEAVPEADAESYVHFGLDDANHPTGGYWFPTGQTWGAASGWVSSKSEVPDGELIQYPCDDRLPEIRGQDELPDWIVRRYIDQEAQEEDP